MLSTWQYDRFIASEWFYRPVIWATSGWTFSIYTRYGAGRMYFDRPTVYVTFKGGHSHRGGSFYSGHHFDKPNPPKGHGNHNGNHNNYGNYNNNGNHNNNHNGNGNWSHNGNHNNGNYNGNHNNGNYNGNHNNGNHNGNSNNGNHNGNSNHNPSIGGGFGHGSGSGSAHAPSRPSGNVANHGNGGTSAAHGTFGGRR